MWVISGGETRGHSWYKKRDGEERTQNSSGLVQLVVTAGSEPKGRNDVGSILQGALNARPGSLGFVLRLIGRWCIFFMNAYILISLSLF